MPKGKKSGYFFFTKDHRPFWSKHSGWWSVSGVTINGTWYPGIAYQTGGMSLREKRILKRCSDSI
jgi:hypothetical protein